MPERCPLCGRPPVGWECSADQLGVSLAYTCEREHTWVSPLRPVPPAPSGTIVVAPNVHLHGYMD